MPFGRFGKVYDSSGGVPFVGVFKRNKTRNQETDFCTRAFEQQAKMDARKMEIAALSPQESLDIWLMPKYAVVAGALFSIVGVIGLAAGIQSTESSSSAVRAEGSQASHEVGYREAPQNIFGEIRRVRQPTINYSGIFHIICHEDGESPATLTLDLDINESGQGITNAHLTTQGTPTVPNTEINCQDALRKAAADLPSIRGVIESVIAGG